MKDTDLSIQSNKNIFILEPILEYFDFSGQNG